MNRLQRKAWGDLAGMTVAVAVAGACLGMMVRFNAQGIVNLMIMLVAGLISGLAAGLWNMRIVSRFDERERAIAQRAFVLSSYAFTGLFAFGAFAVFLIVGGKGRVSVYALPVLLLADMFLAQFIQSAAILIQCVREQADG